MQTVQEERSSDYEPTLQNGPGSLGESAGSRQSSWRAGRLCVLLDNLRGKCSCGLRCRDACVSSEAWPMRPWTPMRSPIPVTTPMDGRCPSVPALLNHRLRRVPRAAEVAWHIEKSTQHGENSSHIFCGIKCNFQIVHYEPPLPSGVYSELILSSPARSLCDLLSIPLDYFTSVVVVVSTGFEVDESLLLRVATTVAEAKELLPSSKCAM